MREIHTMRVWVSRGQNILPCHFKGVGAIELALRVSSVYLAVYKGKKLHKDKCFEFYARSPSRSFERASQHHTV